MKRVNNPSRYIKGIIEVDAEYCIGFGIRELTTLGANHPEIKALLDGIRTRVCITGRSGPLKENTSGKFVRKQPESKTIIWKHIQYYSTKWEKLIDYDREYSIWDKEMLYLFNLELTASKTPQGEIILHFPLFKMKNDEKHYLLAGAAMNMAYALSNYYVMYNSSLEPIIPVTKYKDNSILPGGVVTRSVEEKLDVIEGFLKMHHNVEATGNSYRFAVLKEQMPSDVTMGIGGFDEYLIFEYNEKNLLVFENLRSGNATYIFKSSKFDSENPLDKQTAVRHPAFLKRIVHENMQDWSLKIGRYF